MLIRYSKTYEKIAMGLLSFNPSEKDLQSLFTTINEYVNDEACQLYLWKEEEGFIGVIGVRVDDHQVVLQHLAVNPSHRDKGFGKRMVKEISEQYPGMALRSNETTASFIEKCEIDNQVEKSNQNHPIYAS